MSDDGTKFKLILTGATGMVGEGVLLECLEHPAVEQVLSVSRKSCGRTHPKLSECLVPDFLRLDAIVGQLSGYDACFYCAGISSRGMTEAEYSHVTYDVPLHFAETLLRLNPGIIFCHMSGGHADSSEKGRVMWARVKGRAENAMMRLGFRQVYNFRPGFMKPADGQRNILPFYRAISRLYPVLRVLLPSQVLTMRQVGLAMIHSVLRGYPKQVLEIRDMQVLAEGRAATL